MQEKLSKINFKNCYKILLFNQCEESMAYEINWILNEIAFRGLFSLAQVMIMKLEVATQPLPTDLKKLKEAKELLHVSYFTFLLPILL
jgi:hypothetical protein